MIMSRCSFKSEYVEYPSGASFSTRRWPRSTTGSKQQRPRTATESRWNAKVANEQQGEASHEMKHLLMSRFELLSRHRTHRTSPSSLPTETTVNAHSKLATKPRHSHQ